MTLEELIEKRHTADLVDSIWEYYDNGINKNDLELNTHEQIMCQIENDGFVRTTILHLIQQIRAIEPNKI